MNKSKNTTIEADYKCNECGEVFTEKFEGEDAHDFYQGMIHYKTLEPDKAYIYQGNLERVWKEQEKRRA